MYIHSLDPVFLNIGYFEIRWYSLAYIFGILIGWWLAKKLVNYRISSLQTKFDNNNFDDLISYLIVSIILGGRLGYVFFYNFDYYFKNPIDIIKIWEGGMSFHGALIGIIISTSFFAKLKKISSFFFLDIIACVAPVGLFFGRIANFINGELYGTISSMPWSVIFPIIDNNPRHPSQLYEAILEGIVLFFILNYLFIRKNVQSGICSSLFLSLYGFFRIICEQFREPDIQIGYIFGTLSMGTILSFLMIVIGFSIFLNIKRNEKFK
jgi:phosphatidylglycerol---prolipoprotein diacylglyceryl transferase